MSKLLDRIPWLRANAAKSDAEVESEEGGTQEQPEAQEAATDTEQEEQEQEQTVTLEEIVEQVRTAVLEEVQQALEPIVKAVQDMDQAIQSQDRQLAEVTKSTAEQVKSAMSGGDWLKNLYIRSRDEEAAEQPDPDQPPEAAVLAEGETPSGRIFGQNKA